ncbi:NAD(P)H-binding protein [Lapillicoccus sp.]|uniref:NAD(P)H-binding protein n=1 Tax=Lapillicoccus sp. TaxID=1909287 RepID=UPI0025E6F81A|nr:NAD(P)H-binding protein [Lapillicoccus sp.]
MTPTTTHAASLDTPYRTVLVTGATGKVGRHVVAGLLASSAQVSVRALVRDPAAADLPADLELVAGDLTRPDTLADAAAGVDAVFLLWPGFDPEGAVAPVTALAGHGTHVVYLSAARLQGDDVGVMTGVWSVLERLVEDTTAAGGSHTMIRGGGFAGNTLEWAAEVRDGDTVRLVAPQGGRSLVHERDLAEVAVAALLDPATHAGRAYAVTGPQTLTQVEQVAAIADALGRPLRVEVVTHDDAVRERAGLWGTAAAEQAVAHWESLVGRPERVTHTVEDVLGRPALPFSEWARDHVADFREPAAIRGVGAIRAS